MIRPCRVSLSVGGASGEKKTTAFPNTISLVGETGVSGRPPTQRPTTPVATAVAVHRHVTEPGGKVTVT